MPETKLDAAVAAFEAEDYAVALALFRALAGEGCERAQYHMGLMHLHGLGVPCDERQALAWFQRSAEAGDADAQFMLSPYVRYQHGGPDTDKAMAWLRKAAEQGHREAQRDLGAHLATGELCAKDEAEALQWYLRAAIQGHAEAQYDAGLMLLGGEGCERDEGEGRRWLEAAAKNQDIAAMEVLAEFYLDGLEGFARDPQKAIGWFQASIAQGSARAKFCLGKIYLEGKGVPKDRDKGLALIRESDREGYLYAREVLADYDGE